MNVKFKEFLVFGLLLIICLRTAPVQYPSNDNIRPSNHYYVNNPHIQQKNIHQQRTQTLRPNIGQRKLQTDGGEETEYVEEAPEDDGNVASMDAEEAQIEYEEIRAAVALIEFKLTEVNELIKECIEEEFSTNLIASRDVILTECSGKSFQIMIQNYKEAMRRIRQIFIEILKKKTKSLDAEYEDEIEFFLDTLEEFMSKDFKIKESLEITKEASKYYVSPHFYDDLIKIADPELKAYNAIHHRFRESKKAVQDFINEKLAERNAYVNTIETVVPPPESPPEEIFEEPKHKPLNEKYFDEPFEEYEQKVVPEEEEYEEEEEPQELEYEEEEEGEPEAAPEDEESENSGGSGSDNEGDEGGSGGEEGGEKQDSEKLSGDGENAVPAGDDGGSKGGDGEGGSPAADQGGESEGE